MGIFNFLKGKKPAITEAPADSIVISHIVPLATESLGLFKALIGIDGTIRGDNPNLAALKDLQAPRPFRLICDAKGSFFKAVNGTDRVRIFVRSDAPQEQGKELSPKDMLMWHETRVNGADVFTTTHILHGENAWFAASILPPCCHGESVLVRYFTTVSGNTVQPKLRVIESPQGLELGIGDFFRTSVAIEMANPQQEQELLGIYQKVRKARQP